MDTSDIAISGQVGIQGIAQRRASSDYYKDVARRLKAYDRADYDYFVMEHLQPFILPDEAPKPVQKYGACGLCKTGDIIIPGLGGCKCSNCGEIGFCRVCGGAGTRFDDRGRCSKMSCNLFREAR